MRALGIDVGVRRGLDLVLLGEGREIIETRRRVSVEEIAAIAAASGADVVAVDAPPCWAMSGGHV